MPQISLALLGTFQVHVDAAPVTEFHSNKVRALLAFLAVEADRPHERDFLAALLWPDEPAEQALTRLRQVLHRLGQALDQAAGEKPPLLSTRQAIQLNPAALSELDVTAFMRQIALTAEHRHRRAGSCRSCVERLRVAVSLYRGDFLAGFAGVESLRFEEWLLMWRERLRQQYVVALDHLAIHHELRGEPASAGVYLRQWLEVEPWREEVHRRLMALLARDGQRSAALVQFERCRRALAAELEADPSPETLGLYQRIRAGALGADPSAARGVAGLLASTLPASTMPLIGREQELALIADMLADSRCRLLTLVGPGGSGKTHLALAAAEAEGWAFASGAAFVRLTEVGDDDDLAAEITRQLGAPPERQGTVAQLLAFLRDKEMLLVLDTFEHLVEQASLIRQLLHGAPRVTLLVTSREPLRLEAEHTLRVAGLDCPPDQHDALDSYPASLLFLEVARRIDPGFALDAGARLSIARICRLVGGIPLALGLAAAQIERRAPAAIADAIAHDLDALASTLRDTQERHRSVRAVFAQSWRLLSPEEQHLLAHCTVFYGGFNADAVAAVSAQEQRALEESAGQLTTLVNKSLVRRLDATRYELHDLVRQFAAERLDSDPEVSGAARARHSAYYLGLLARHADALSGPEVRQAVTLLGVDLDDIRAAWQWAVAHGDVARLDAAAQPLSDLYSLSGLYAEGAAAFGSAAARLRDLAGARPTHVRLLVEQAHMLYPRSEYTELIIAASAAAELAQAEGLALLEAAALVEIGKVLWRQGAVADASAQLRQALADIVAAGTNDRASKRLTCEALYYLGLSAWNQGAFEEARAHYTASLRQARAIGYRFGEGDALNNLALVAVFQGDYVEASELASEALAVYRSSGSRGGEALGLISLGLAHMYQHHYQEAQHAYEESLRIHEQIGDRQNTGMCHILLGIHRTRVGDYTAARAALDAGLAVSRTIDHAWGVCMALSYAGLLAHLAGAPQDGLRACREGLALSEQINDPVIGAYALNSIGHLLTDLGELEEAATAYRRALELRHALGQRHLTVEPMAGLAQLALCGGDAPGALALAEEILALTRSFILQGPEEPFWIYLVCYRALAASGDPRADGLLKSTCAMLNEHAARLPGERARTMFLEGVAAHRELRSLISER